MSRLEARGLTLRRGGRPVVRDLDLSLRAGEVTVLLGPNGAGKSTLLEALCGLLRPASGQVLLDGGDLAALEPAARARRIGLLPQTHEIAWSGSWSDWAGFPTSAPGACQLRTPGSSTRPWPGRAPPTLQSVTPPPSPAESGRGS